MCLSTLGRVIAVDGDGLTRTATVEMGGSPRTISLAMVPEAGVGAWVTVHAGYALEVLSEEDAEALLDLTDEIARNL